MTFPPRSASGGSLRTSLLIGVVCFLVYNVNFRSIAAGDTFPARCQPFGLLRYGTLSLDPILKFAKQGRAAGNAYWMRPGREGRTISIYPVVLPVVISPLYVPAALVLQSQGWPEESLDRAAEIMEKLAASLIAATSAALLYLLLLRRASPRLALLLTLVYAFGTTTWVISSQALWQHGLGELLLVSALLLVTGPATTRRAVAAGFVVALLAGNRPPDAFLAAAIGVQAFFWARRRSPWFLAAAAIPAGMILAYNLVAAGHWAGGYGLASKALPGFLDSNPLQGLAGLLFSPGHGLFVFSPFLLVVPIGLIAPLAFRRVRTDAENRRLTLALSIGIALQLYLYSRARDWTGGGSWGPRWLTDILPILFWMLPPIVGSLRRVGRFVFAFGCAIAIVIEAIGAFWYMEIDDAAIEKNPKAVAWNIRLAPFVAELQHGPAPMTFLPPQSRCDSTAVQGGLDLLDGLSPDREIPSSDELLAEGWTLIGGRSPWQVSIVVDGQTLASTSRFRTRPDVVRAVGSTSPAGWSVWIRTTGLSTGEHQLRVVAQSCPSGEPLVVAERRILVAAVRSQAPTKVSARASDCDAAAVQGGLDVVGDRAVTEELPISKQLLAKGWTLVGGGSPWEVAITLGGQRVGATTHFYDRPDVVKAVGTKSPAGWTIPIDTTLLARGERQLHVEARRCPGGPPLLVAKYTVAPEAPPANGQRQSQARAAALLEERQKSEGYWLTSYTAAPLFGKPTLEMNTFLTSMLVDLLDPLAADAGLGDILKKARSHLAAQIEDGGLVRYHGLPDAPTIGSLGCAISPDADDTALVWRLAPGPTPERLRLALATLGEYRTAEGLYRTWLSPRAGYRCIDPGRDPNPTDAVIQIHVLQLLAREEPAAARALCKSLSRVIDEDRAWVYYRMAPLVPILRQSDLENAGCALALPAARLRSSVPGQEKWVEAATLLQRFESRRAPLPTSKQTLALLSALAADDFALLRSSPPLLYHNDQTASTPRFYWSEDFGYALWLRLHHEHLHRRPASGRAEGHR